MLHYDIILYNIILYYIIYTICVVIYYTYHIHDVYFVYIIYKAMRLRITQHGVSCNECNHQGFNHQIKPLMIALVA